MFVLGFSVYGFSQAANVYITPSGTSQGVCTSNPQTPAWFNNSANWGTGNSQIGPGTTVHLCGTFTGGAGVNYLTFQGGGASGNPITLLFENGSSMTQPYCGPGGVACINLNHKSYITVDGGTACGATMGGGTSLNSCNGFIQNTLNGTAGGVCPGGTCQYQQSSYMIDASSTTGAEIRNLGFYDIYDRTSNSDNSIDQSQLVAIIVASSANINIHDNLMHDGGWFIPGWSNGFTFNNNYCYNMDHCIAFGNGNTNITAPSLLQDNHFGSTANWDGPGCPYHHDGVHFWAQQSGSTGSVSNVYLIRNKMDGNQGQGSLGCFNAMFYIEQGISNVVAYNNLAIIASGSTSAGVLTLANKPGSTVTGMYAYNNTVMWLPPVDYTGDTLQFTEVSGNSVAEINNVLQGGSNTITIGTGGEPAPPCTNPPGGSSIPGCVLTNIYENIGADGGGYNEYGYDGSNTAAVKTWQGMLPSGSGGDAGAKALSPLSAFLLGSNGAPQSGSPLIQAGTNLTPICGLNSYMAALCSDMFGNPRPTSGAWDVGALSYSSGGGAPGAPTGLTAVVQ